MNIPVYTYPVIATKQEKKAEISQAASQKATYELPESGSPIPRDAIKRSGIKIRFKWRATSDGTYFLNVGSQEISSETVHELLGEHLYVYHPFTGRVFILKSFVARTDGIWRKGTTYD